MTLGELYDRMDWTLMDLHEQRQRENMGKKFVEIPFPQKRQIRSVIMEVAMYGVEGCGDASRETWTGYVEMQDPETTERLLECSQTNAQRDLGPIWKQVVGIMTEEGIIEEEKNI